MPFLLIEALFMKIYHIYIWCQSAYGSLLAVPPASLCCHPCQQRILTLQREFFSSVGLSFILFCTFLSLSALHLQFLFFYFCTCANATPFFYFLRRFLPLDTPALLVFVLSTLFPILYFECYSVLHLLSFAFFPKTLVVIITRKKWNILGQKSLGFL